MWKTTTLPEKPYFIRLILAKVLHYIKGLKFSLDGKTLLISSLSPQKTELCPGPPPEAEMNLYRFSTDVFAAPAEKIFTDSFCDPNSSANITQFTQDDKLFLYLVTMGDPYRNLVANLNLSATVEKHKFDDISSDGNMYAYETEMDQKPVTNLVDFQSGKIIHTLPYRVRLLKGNTIFLVRSFDARSEWKLWKNGEIACAFHGIETPTFYGVISGDKTTMVTSKWLNQKGEILIWDIQTCSVRNIIQFSP